MRNLLARILDTPHLDRVVPHLPPQVLHRVIDEYGLEDCIELVALATPAQLAAVFDLDLWKARQPGLDDTFDPERFGVWLGVLLEAGIPVAVRKLAEMDVNLVIAGLTQHVRVFDLASMTEAIADDMSSDISGCRVIATRADAWDSIVTILTALAAANPPHFHRLMRGCIAFSDSTPEIDGLDNLLGVPEQAMFDLEVAREQRREAQGYMTPAQARAFLQMSRQLKLGAKGAPPDNPIANAYFRAIAWAGEEEADSAPRTSAAAIVELLLEEGVLPPLPRALLGGEHGAAPRHSRVLAALQSASDKDPDAYSARQQELAYLANVLAAGCAIQDRPMTTVEASEAAVAACNLGLENWPSHWPATDDLIRAFQVGWAVLYADVCMYSTDALLRVLSQLKVDGEDVRADVKTLRRELAKHAKDDEPWKAREAFDVMMMLDMPAWAALLGLIAECPVIHGAVVGPGRGKQSVSASEFAFISENAQIATVRTFLETLPEALRG